MTAVWASLLSVLVVSAVALVGLVTLSLSEVRVQRLALPFVAFAVGGLLGDAFLHLVPAIFGGHGHGAEAAPAQGGTLGASLLILAGMLVFFVVEKLLRHRHGALHARAHPEEAHATPPIATLNLVGDGVHNFIDGALIGASWLASPTLGLATTVAVVLHEVPQELGDFGILVHSGLTVRRALWLNLLTASTAVVGCGAALALGAWVDEAVHHVLLPVTAGGFLYLAAANLVPELQEDHSLKALVWQTALISAGVAVMAALTLLG